MADTKQIVFELVSPERLLLSKPVDMVVVPGTEGLFGVLVGHTPLISTLKPGVIEVYEDNRITDRIFVAGGFAEVAPERCVVLAELATPVGELDRAAIAERIAALEAEAGPAANAPRPAPEGARLRRADRPARHARRPRLTPRSADQPAGRRGGIGIASS